MHSNDTLARTELWKLRAPLARPIVTPWGPFTHIHAIVVRLRAADGTEGCGYAAAYDAASLERQSTAVRRMTAGATLADLAVIERADAAAPDSNADTRSAASALSLAAWDLLGRRHGVACADLWGRSPGRIALMAYASALFFDRTSEELAAEAAGYRRDGYQLVKMRGGLEVDADLEHYDAVRTAYPEPGRIAIDYVFQYDVPRTQDFVARASAPLLWVEDPVGYEKIGRLADLQNIAAGESCASTGELLALRRQGIRHLILDVQVLGGPMRFLEAARALHALGCRVGSHLFAHESTHLLSVLPQSMPVEVLDWWNPLFEEVPLPGEDGRLAVRGPGLGRTLRDDSLARYGQPIV